jgi:beta-glucanase (GH16 family)
MKMRFHTIMLKYVATTTTVFLSLLLPITSNAGVDNQLVWAVNVGGTEVKNSQGSSFAADACAQVICLDVDNVKGTHNQQLYRTYREGNLSFQRPVENGLYDVTLHFMEPLDIAVGKRRFDVLIEDVAQIKNLDIRGLRDGKIQSALSRTIPNIEVTDGTLSISLSGSKRLPVISGFEVYRRIDTDETNWQLVWRDEFNQDGPVDSEKWSKNIWPSRKVNSEDQTYTERSKNLRVEDGLLIIEAHKETFRGAEYTSARIHTEGKLDLLYGKIEVSARLPKGQGTWPAIWMLPSNPFRYATTCEPDDDWQGSKTCDAWPNSGEIDIMEHVGYDANIVHGTVHTKSNYWKTWNQHKGSIQLDDVHKHFYRYGLIWTADTITTTVNDIPYFTYHRNSDDWQQWPFKDPFNIILNLAIGGDWGRAGGPIDNSAFPLRMEVDYVRVYKTLQD